MFKEAKNKRKYEKKTRNQIIVAFEINGWENIFERIINYAHQFCINILICYTFCQKNSTILSHNKINIRTLQGLIRFIILAFDCDSYAT